MKYSIITPVYNSYHLMKRYFASMEAQTYKNFELVLIDDHSSDNSYEHLVKHAESSKLTITVLRTQKNMGPGYARNMGLDKASGEWITFVDNDDWVELDWLEKIDEVVCIHDVDCVVYDYYIQGKGAKKPAHSMLYGSGGFLSKSDCIAYITNHTIGKFYKLANCSNIRFPHIRRCEDVAFTCLAIEQSSKIYYLQEPLYYYFQRKTSLSNNRKLDERDLIQAFSILEKQLSVTYPQEIAEKAIRDLLYGVVLIMCKAKKSSREIIDYLEMFECRYLQWYQSSSIRQLGWPKRLFLTFAKNRVVLGLRFLSWIHTMILSL